MHRATIVGGCVALLALVVQCRREIGASSASFANKVMVREKAALSHDSRGDIGSGGPATPITHRLSQSVVSEVSDADMLEQMERDLLPLWDDDGDGVLSESERSDIRLSLFRDYRGSVRHRFEVFFNGPLGLSDLELALIRKMSMEEALARTGELQSQYERVRLSGQADAVVNEWAIQRELASVESAYLLSASFMPYAVSMRFDVNGDFTLSDSERKEAQRRLRIEVRAWAESRLIDQDRNGQLDEGEAAKYLSNFDAGSLGADLNLNGRLDVEDFQRFLANVGL